MAKKLNKKVVIIGIVLLGGLGMLIAAVAVNELWRKNPARFISRAEGKAAEGDYEGAGLDYYAAFSRSKKKEQQLEMLEITAEMFKKAGAWDKVVGCWNKMAGVDPTNWEARRNIIGYYKQRADSGEIGIWTGIETSVDELIEAQLDEDLEIDPELYYLKGKALYFSASMGGTLDKKETAEQAIENFEKSIELSGDDVNVDAYWHMALSVLLKGQAQEESGLLGAEENARANAKSLLEQCQVKVPDDPNAALYLVNVAVGKTREEILEVEEDYLALADKFNEPVVYNVLSNYYDRLGMKLKALDASVKSLELDGGEVNAVIKTATLYFAAYNINGNEEDRDTAISLAVDALDMPDTQDENSYITQAANRNRKLAVHSLLSEIYLSYALAIEDVNDRSDAIELAADQVHKIKQMIASEESVISYRLDGLLNLAKGNDSLAVKQMYTAYQKYIAAKQSGEFMSYMLAKSFAGTSETGAVVEFLGNALSSFNYLSSHPSQLLEYVNIFVVLNPTTAINVLDRYDDIFGVDDASKQARLRVYIKTGQSELARELMDEYPEGNADKVLAQVALLANDTRQNFGTIMQLKAKIENGDQSAVPVLEQIEAENNRLQGKQIDMVYGLLQSSPKSVDSRNFTSIINYYVKNEKFDNAMEAVKLYLKENPDDLSAKIFVKILGESNPADVTVERRVEITVGIIEAIDEPLKRALSLAKYYQMNQKLEDAIDYYWKALAIEADNKEAAAGIFEIAVAQKDMELIDELVAMAVEYDYDDCQGGFYQARAEMVKENYEQALSLLNSCQEKRPVYSILYLLRARVYSQLGQYEEALEDIHIAAKYNPLNSEFSRTLAVMLYQRNLRLGDNATADELTEAKTALQSAIRMSPNDAGLQSIYAEYLSQNDPERVLAMLQAMQKQDPSIDNAIRISVTAIKIATRTDPPIMPTVRNAMLEIAESSINQALELEPDNDAATRIYVNLLQIKGELDKAEELIKDKKDLLWRFYLQNGKYENAKEILLQIYDGGDRIADTLVGLLTVSQRLRETEGVEKYSTELIESSPDDVEMRLLQVRSYLEVDMLDKVQGKLASLIARYPDEPRAYLLKAFVDMRNSKLQEALEAVNQALRNDPEDAKAWKLKGEINYLQANFNDAIDDLKKSKSINPEPEVRIALAKAYLQTDQISNAKTELKIASQDPQSPVVAWLLLEDLYLKANMSSDITKFYDRALEQSEENPAWLNKYANYCFSAKQFAKAGELYLQSWKKSQPQGSVEAMEGYVNVLAQEKKYSAIIRFSLKHIDGNYATVAYNSIGEAKYNLGDTESANEFFVKALKKAVGNYPVVSKVSVEISEVVGLDEAVALVKEALGSNPVIVDFAQYSIYGSRSEYAKALEYLERCIAANPNEQDVAAFNSLRLRILQTLYAQTKSNEYLNELISEYEKLLAKNPDNTMVLNNAAYLIAESGLDIVKAKLYAGRAYRKIPNNPGIMDTYAFVLLQEGNNEEALELLIKAKQLFEKQSAFGPTDFYEHLGLANKELENIDMAIAAYELALEAGKGTLSESDVDRINGLIIELENNR